MAIENTDVLAAYRGSNSQLYKISIEDLKAYGDGPVAISETAPADPAEGDLWWADTDTDEGGGRLYTWTGSQWVDVSIPGGTLSEEDGDARYISKLTDDTAVGEITFEGMTSHIDGIHVDNGTLPSNASNKIYPLIYGKGSQGGRSLNFKPRSKDATESVLFSVQPPQHGSGGVQIIHNKTYDGSQVNNLKVQGDWSGDFTGEQRSNRSFPSYLLVTGSVIGSTSEFDKPITGVGVGFTGDSSSHLVSYRATGKGSPEDVVASWIGYKSEIRDFDAAEAYNFFALGDAPNFLAGSTYIGLTPLTSGNQR